jgi:5-methylcytosine-specific restriction endonuclease McrA
MEMKMLRPLTTKAAAPSGARSKAGDERQALYVGRRWRRLRDHVLRREPLCRECLKRGRTTAATVVDHIHGHGPGWQQRFFDMKGLQPLCADCHSAKTAQETRARGGEKATASELSITRAPSRDKKPAPFKKGPA